MNALDHNHLAKIHIAKKALALADDDYRAILKRLAGVESAKNLTLDDLLPLQREFRRLGWDGYLLRRGELRGAAMVPKYDGMDDRPGRPSGAQLRMLEARVKNIRGFAETAPDAAFRGFIVSVAGVSHANLLDLKGFEQVLTVVKRLEKERGVKKEYVGR
jgi:hypothetical protein